jgi:hypothetical protein
LLFADPALPSRLPSHRSGGLLLLDQHPVQLPEIVVIEKSTIILAGIWPALSYYRSIGGSGEPGRTLTDAAAAIASRGTYEGGGGNIFTGQAHQLHANNGDHAGLDA